MSNTLLTPAADGRFVRHTVDTIDDWWHQLPADVKVRIFWLEMQEPAAAGALYDEVRNSPLRITEVAGRSAPRPDLLACIAHPDGSHTTVSMETACQLAGAGAIAERTSYSDDHFDGAPTSLYFEVTDAEAFAREVRQ